MQEGFSFMDGIIGCFWCAHDDVLLCRRLARLVGDRPRPTRGTDPAIDFHTCQ